MPIFSNPYVLKSEQMKLFNLSVATGLTINGSKNDDSVRETMDEYTGFDARAAKFKGMSLLVFTYTRFCMHKITNLNHERL